MTNELSVGSEVHLDEEAFQKGLPFAVVPTNLAGVYTRQAVAGLSLGKQDKPVMDVPLSEVLKARGRTVSSSLDRPDRGLQFGRIYPVLTDDTTLNPAYAGAVFANGYWDQVTATWAVPTVTQPATAPGVDGDWDCSCWLGLDGLGIETRFNETPTGIAVSKFVESVGPDSLVAGVYQYVDDDGTAWYYAWYAWYAQFSLNAPVYTSPVQLSGLSVGAGDKVTITVNYLNTVAGGLVRFNNNTNGQEQYRVLQIPPGASYKGVSAAWILECPNGGYAEAGNAVLPKFTPVIFTAAVAQNADNPSNTNPNAERIGVDIGDSTGKRVTETLLGPELVSVDYVGS